MTHTSTEQPAINELCQWFNEGDGFKQGTAAPHKWVLQANSEISRLHARIAELEAQLSATHPTQQGLDAADTIRLNWLDAQVKNHAVYNGFLWQEVGWESDRGLVCAIQGKKQKKTVRQAIDAAIAAQAKQGEQ